MPVTAHQKLIKRQREYLFVGGMPEAVQVFVETGALGEVTAVRRSIAETHIKMIFPNTPKKRTGVNAESVSTDSPNYWAEG